ncbi:hypothetical protein CRG98_031183 [Punica granatum]|uniref:Uncharacterized protein n=1 Tax=Punica granatum TaxID=22663 RepID=A0A2I0IWM9_PUNGR|nr:hypothetical protein CRG98_031183 [Punica granatum]
MVDVLSDRITEGTKDVINRRTRGKDRSSRETVPNEFPKGKFMPIMYIKSPKSSPFSTSSAIPYCWTQSSNSLLKMLGHGPKREMNGGITNRPHWKETSSATALMVCRSSWQLGFLVNINDAVCVGYERIRHRHRHKCKAVYILPKCASSLKPNLMELAPKLIQEAWPLQVPEDSCVMDPGLKKPKGTDVGAQKQRRGWNSTFVQKLGQR